MLQTVHATAGLKQWRLYSAKRILRQLLNCGVYAVEFETAVTAQSDQVILVAGTGWQPLVIRRGAVISWLYEFKISHYLRAAWQGRSGILTRRDLRDHACVTLCRQRYDRWPATDSLGDIWKPICLEPRNHGALLRSIFCAIQIPLLTYLLTYLLTCSLKCHEGAVIVFYKLCGTARSSRAHFVLF